MLVLDLSGRYRGRVVAFCKAHPRRLDVVPLQYRGSVYFR